MPREKEESHPSIFLIIGIQTPVSRRPWLWSWSPWRTVFIMHRWKSLYGSTGFQWKSYIAHCWREKQNKTKQAPKHTSLDALDRVRGWGWLYMYQCSPKAVQLSANRDLFCYAFFPRRKWESVSGHMASTAVRDAVKETHFSVTTSSVLNCELHAWGQDTSGTVADSTIRWHVGELCPTTCITAPSRSLPTSHWEHIALVFPGLAHGHPQCITPMGIPSVLHAST